MKNSNSCCNSSFEGAYKTIYTILSYQFFYFLFFYISAAFASADIIFYNFLTIQYFLKKIFLSQIFILAFFLYQTQQNSHWLNSQNLLSMICFIAVYCFYFCSYIFKLGLYRKLKTKWMNEWMNNECFLSTTIHAICLFACKCF